LEFAKERLFVRLMVRVALEDAGTVITTGDQPPVEFNCAQLAFVDAVVVLHV
jgi:hypothetical protein